MSDSETIPPTHLTGGVGRTKNALGQPLEALPNLVLSECPPDYARLILWGWDSIQETWNIKPDGPWRSVLERGKERAQANRQNGDGVAIIEIDGEPWRIRASGAAGGVSFVMDNGALMFFIRGAGVEWGVGVRYLAAGLWLVGWDALQVDAERIIRKMFRAPNEIDIKVTRCDWCFDFTAPGFRLDAMAMRRDMVHHSSVKYRCYGTSEKDETFTVGSIKNLQLTVYDKAKEITDISGKDYFIDAWAAGNDGVIPFDDKPKDIWRLELRIGKEALKARQCRTRAEIIEKRANLIAGALARIRLTVDNGDQNKRRRPVHPLWSEALRHCDVAEQLPVGKYVTGQREALLDRMAKQMAGTLRSFEVLRVSECGDDGIGIALSHVVNILNNDPDDAKKQAAARDRYKFVKGSEG